MKTTQAQKTTPVRTVDVESVKSTGIAAAADGKITAKEKNALLRDFRKLSESDRGAALTALRAEAPRAAQLVTPSSGGVTAAEFDARLRTDLAVGPTSPLFANSKNEARKAGLTTRTQDAFFRLSAADQAVAKQALAAAGLSEKAIEQFTTPPVREDMLPSWNASSVFKKKEV